MTGTYYTAGVTAALKKYGAAAAVPFQAETEETKKTASVDLLGYGPARGTQKAYADRPVRLFFEEWRRLELPPPPKNSAPETRAELAQIQQEMAAVTLPQRTRIHAQDAGIERAFQRLLESAGTTVSARAIHALTDELTTICLHFKQRYDRARPEQLFEAYGEATKPMRSANATTPAYPSGHAFIAWFLALYYGSQYPDLREELVALAQDIGWNRVRAGLHYPSDYYAGVSLAHQLLPYVKVSPYELERI